MDWNDTNIIVSLKRTKSMRKVDYSADGLQDKVAYINFDQCVRRLTIPFPWDLQRSCWHCQSWTFFQ